MVGNLLALTKSRELYSVTKKAESIYYVLEACHLENFVGSHTLKKEVSSNIPPVMMDFALMQILICNLIIKAVERSPEGGSLCLTVQSDQSALTIKIADQGPALPEDTLPTLFDVFPDQEIRSPGIALGLAIAKNIVEAHQGSIRASNLPKGGLEISLEIPMNS